MAIRAKMSVKGILYALVLLLSIVALDSININQIFKKNRYYQSRLLVIFLAFGLTYLVVNFLYDFFQYSRIF